MINANKIRDSPDNEKLNLGASAVWSSLVSSVVSFSKGLEYSAQGVADLGAISVLG